MGLLGDPVFTEDQESCVDSDTSMDRNVDLQGDSDSETSASSIREEVLPVNVPDLVKVNELESKVDISGSDISTQRNVNPYSAADGEETHEGDTTGAHIGDETTMGVFDGGDNTSTAAEEVHHTLGSVTHKAELNEPEIIEVEEGESEESIDRNEDFQGNTSLVETPSSSNRKKVISIPHPVKPYELESKVDISGTNVSTQMNVNPRCAADGDIHQEEIHECNWSSKRG